MNTIVCWRLESVGDDRNSLVARFSTREEAERASSCAGGYGPNIEREELIVWDSAVEFKPQFDEISKASGLAKLTAKEKKALGIEA